MKVEIKKELWVIMSKDRKVIAKGVPRSRYLELLDSDDTKRILTYSTENKARLGFSNGNGFYGQHILSDYQEHWNNYHKGLCEKPKLDDYLEAVKVEFMMKEI